MAKQTNTNRPYTTTSVKVAILGTAGVGKTELKYRFGSQWKKQFERPGAPPLGPGQSPDVRELRVNDVHADVKFDIVELNYENNSDADTIETALKQGVEGVIFIYSVADKSSIGPTFDKIAECVCRAKDVQSTADFPCILFGNKLDLRKKPNAVGEFLIMIEGFNKGKSMGVSEFLEGSALTGENVDNAFGQIAKAVITARWRRDRGEEKSDGRGKKGEEKGKCAIM